MKRSSERILTTHVGSLPRPDALLEQMDAFRLGHQDARAFRQLAADAVDQVVRRQVEVGIDVISDGEQSKLGFVDYVATRLSGLHAEHVPPSERTLHPSIEKDFPEYLETEYMRSLAEAAGAIVLTCVGPVEYVGRAELEEDIENLRRAVDAAGAEEAFIPSALPSLVTAWIRGNEHYASNDELLFAVADAMRTEYRAIVDAGFLVQLDAPDLASWPAKPGDSRLEAMRRALEGIPPDRVRLHLCWGNWEGPHTGDPPLRDALKELGDTAVGAISYEGANPRHEHEWHLFESFELPEEMILIPGVIDTTTNFVEHPELVAERIVRLGELVGRERIIASTDCGFGTAAFHRNVHPAIVWAKLGSLVEGARLASARLWP